MKLAIACGTTVLGLLAVPATAGAGTITFSTANTDIAATATNPFIANRGAAPGAALPGAWGWNYTGDTADAQRPVYGILPPAFQNLVCIGTGGDCASNDNDGLPGAEYRGFEFIYFNFTLPGDATNVALHFLTLDADDRDALSVNGTLIGGFKGSQAQASVVVPNMRYGTGAGDVQAITSVKNNVFTLDDPALFNVGGDNNLRFWINNTFQGVLGEAIPHQNAGDPSALYAIGWISYDQVPQGAPVPATLALLGLGCAGLALGRRRD